MRRRKSTPSTGIHEGKETIRFKQIRAVYQDLEVHDPTHPYISPLDRYTSPEMIYNTFSYLRHETREIFVSCHLDAKNKPLAVDIVSIGTLNQSLVHPREVFKTALLSSAAAIILIHNHPSGQAEPSREDISITKRLKEAADIIGINLLDHIIIGDTFTSFAARGLL